MNFNESMKYPMSYSMTGLWILSIVLLLLSAPQAHTRLTDDLNPQSPEQLAQQLITAIESKQLSQVMRLFNWEGVAIEDVYSMKALWAQTLDEEDLVQVKVIPLSGDVEIEEHIADYDGNAINDSHHDSQLVINGELKILFKARQENGFLSTVSMTLPYGAMTIEGGFKMYSVSLLDRPAIN